MGKTHIAQIVIIKDTFKAEGGGSGGRTLSRGLRHLREARRAYWRRSLIPFQGKSSPRPTEAHAPLSRSLVPPGKISCPKEVLVIPRCLHFSSKGGSPAVPWLVSQHCWLKKKKKKSNPHLASFAFFIIIFVVVVVLLLASCGANASGSFFTPIFCPR